MILHEKITVYSARASTRSILKNLRAIAKDLPQAHELGLRLFKRNLKAAYQQSLLGFGWALLPPILTAALWIFLRSNGVMKTDITGISYPVFVLTGTMLWQIFNESILSPINSVGQNKAMLTKINIPREGLLISGLYDLAFHTFIKVLGRAGPGTAGIPAAGPSVRFVYGTRRCAGDHPDRFFAWARTCAHRHALPGYRPNHFGRLAIPDVPYPGGVQYAENRHYQSGDALQPAGQPDYDDPKLAHGTTGARPAVFLDVHSLLRPAFPARSYLVPAFHADDYRTNIS